MSDLILSPRCDDPNLTPLPDPAPGNGPKVNPTATYHDVLDLDLDCFLAAGGHQDFCIALGGGVYLRAEAGTAPNAGAEPLEKTTWWVRCNTQMTEGRGNIRKRHCICALQKAKCKLYHKHS